MHSLVLHPDCDRGPVRAVTATIRPTAHGFDANYRIEGDIGAIVIPAHAPSARTDELWRTTCFEVFWQPDGGPAYSEFNFSPASRWAAYAFTGERDGRTDLAVPSIAMACSHDDRTLDLSASIAAACPAPARVALSVVVEAGDGALQYWALKHPAGPPDFHAASARIIPMEPS